MRMTDYGKALFFGAVLATGLGVGAAFAQEQKPLSAPPATEQAKPAPDSESSSPDAALKQLEQSLEVLKGYIKAVRDTTGIAAEGLAIIDTISAETAKIAEMELKCLEGDDAQCAKTKRERCPQLSASHEAIKKRFEAFDKRLEDSALPDEVKVTAMILSDQISSGIKQLKEQLEKGHCVDA